VHREPSVEEDGVQVPENLLVMRLRGPRAWWLVSSMQEIARQAIREYVEGHSRAELLDRVLAEELPRCAEALERLAQ
jgi:hypothetical protein